MSRATHRVNDPVQLDERGPSLDSPASDPRERLQEAMMLDLLKGVEERLSGRAEDEIVGSLSYNRFPVAALASRPAEGAASHRDALRRPNTFGARFLISKASVSKASLSIAFSFKVFHPVYPRWGQIAHLVRPPAVRQDSVRIPDAEQGIGVTFAQKVLLADVYNDPLRARTWSLAGLAEARSQVQANPRTMKMNDSEERYFLRGRRYLPRAFFDVGEQQRPNAYEVWVAEQCGGGIAVVPSWQGEVEVTMQEQGDLVEVAVVFANTSEQEAGTTDWKGFFHDCRFTLQLSGAHVVEQPLGDVVASDYRVSASSEATGIHCCVRTTNGETVQNLPIPSFVLPHTEPNASFAKDCRFSELAKDSCLEGLDRIASAMDNYATDWRNRKDQLLGPNPTAMDTQSFEDALKAYEEEVERFRNGCHVLRNDANARRAFKLVNRAMDLSNGTSHGAGGFDSWHTYQMVFLVSTLKDVVVRERPDWGEIDDRDNVDVVWVATGGGKTETYLGLIGFTLFFDRLRGKERGLSAWVKFPLRMLSLDQLDRFCRLFLILNQVAKEEALPGDDFSIGYYMGDANTPNAFSVSPDFQRYGMSPRQIGDELNRLARASQGTTEEELSRVLFEERLQERDKKRYRLMTRCPGRGCQQPVYVWVDLNLQRTYLKCVHHGPLPIVFVDDEIYRVVPSTIISTIDKLAILAFNPEVRNLIVRPYGHCRTHGYYSARSIAMGSCRACGNSRDASGFRLVSPDEFYDPSPAIQIQDELHLLKEQLGSYDSHYESLVDFLHTRLLPTTPAYGISGAKGRTKIVGATATINHYERQVAQLYGRGASARRFPVWGQRLHENFYMKRTRAARRILTSLWAVNMSLPVAHDEVIFSYWARLAELMRSASARAGLLESAHVEPASISADDWKWVLDKGATTLSYFQNKQKAYQRIQDLRGGLNKFAAEYRASDAAFFLDVSQRLAHLTGDSNFEEIRLTKSHLEAPWPSEDWLAHLAATSIISHGVDVSRLGFILFSGQPSEVAEYIQASSRVGRRHLGLSLVIGDSLRDRDELHYINHILFHEHQDEFVTGASISRYSRNLIFRTFPGLLLALLQLYWNPTRPSQAYHFKANDAEQVSQALGDPACRAALEPIIAQFLQEGTPDQAIIRDQISDVWSGMQREGRQNQNRGRRFRERFPHFQPLTNHREIEEAFQIQVFGDDARFLDASNRARTRDADREEGPGHTVEDAPDEQDAARPNYSAELGDA